MWKVLATDREVLWARIRNMTGLGLESFLKVQREKPTNAGPLEPTAKTRTERGPSPSSSPP